MQIAHIYKDPSDSWDSVEYVVLIDGTLTTAEAERKYGGPGYTVNLIDVKRQACWPPSLPVDRHLKPE